MKTNVPTACERIYRLGVDMAELWNKLTIVGADLQKRGKPIRHYLLAMDLMTAAYQQMKLAQKEVEGQ